MKAEALVTELRAAGIEPRPNGNLYLAPKARLTPALIERVRAAKTVLLAYLSADGWQSPPEPGHAAYSILETCERYGVAMRLDSATGDLVIGKAGATAHEPTQPWRSLIIALEAHLEPVAALVHAGWTLKADMPRKSVA
jgi:hypothetical protein